jgi:uncharacterized protein
MPRASTERSFLFAALGILGALVLAAPAAAQDGGRVAPSETEDVDPQRFGEREPDAAYGAFQRGLYLTARNLALPRAEAGNGPAQVLLGEIYRTGLGVRRDDVEAARWYEKAADQGLPDAQFRLAMLLLEGEGVPRDVDRAAQLMGWAADAGNPQAQFNLAQLILARESSVFELERAVSYFDLAAEAGVPDAQYAMAQVYMEGAGGRPRDLAAARLWLERAARQNFDTAQLELGTWLVEGVGGPADHRTGFAWLLQAARGGNVAAQNRVAKLYRAGVGVDADEVTAAYWYLAARRAGLVDPDMEDYIEGLDE